MRCIEVRNWIVATATLTSFVACASPSKTDTAVPIFTQTPAITETISPEIVPTATLLPEFEGTYGKIVVPGDVAEFSLFAMRNDTEMYLHIDPEHARITFYSFVPELDISWDMNKKPEYIFSSEKDWLVEREEGERRDWVEVVVLPDGGAKMYLHVKYDEYLVGQTPGSSMYYSKSLSALMIKGLLDYGVQKGIYTEDQAQRRLDWYIDELSTEKEFHAMVTIVEEQLLQVNR